MEITHIYIICIFVLFLFCLFLLKKLYEFSLIILNLEESVENCLDILDERYASMNSILQKPIFFDSIEIRQVISDIRDCHNAVLIIANILTRGLKNKNEIEEKSRQEKEQ